jgi:hypothetical protein
MQKDQIINALIAENKYRKYLEICTTTTGWRFSRIDKKPLRWRHRLMYRCPERYRDGQEITFRSTDEQIDHLLDPTLLYDLIFIDPHHTLECSARDLKLALELIRQGGTIVVHDCCPRSRDVCSASFRPGSWFGLTYCAYIDFVLSHPEVAFYTVDSDCGCGVIKKAFSRNGGEPETAANARNSKARGFTSAWIEERRRNHEMFDFFEQNHRELLNLISVEDFLAVENIELPRFWRWRGSFSWPFARRMSRISARDFRS